MGQTVQLQPSSKAQEKKHHQNKVQSSSIPSATIPNSAPRYPISTAQSNLLLPPPGDAGQPKAGSDTSSQPHRPQVRQQAPDQRAAGPLQPHKEAPSSLELPGTQPGESQPQGLLSGQRPTAPSPLGCCFCQSHVGKQGEPREKSSCDLPRLNIPAGHPFRENKVPDNQARAPSGKDKDVLHLRCLQAITSVNPTAPKLCSSHSSSQKLVQPEDQVLDAPWKLPSPTTFSPNIKRGRPGLGEVWAVS